VGLQKKDREIALHGFESGRIVRLPGGEYVEVHEKLSDYERWKLVSFDDYAPIMLRPDKRGRITARARLRARMSSWFFEDRIAPVSLTEIEASHHDHAPELEQSHDDQGNEIEPARAGH
jgi:ubiquinol-cytochrome c reductase cytochrome b subunit